MRRLAFIPIVVACRSPAAPPAAAVELPGRDDASSDDAANLTTRDGAVAVERDSTDAGRPSPFAALSEVLASPDRVEAFALSTRDFFDAPAGARDRIAGYPIVRKLPPPSPAFAAALAEIVLGPNGYRWEAVQCSLSHRSVGFRFFRGADVADISLLAQCPSVHARSNLLAAFVGGQLDPARADRLAALIRSAYPPWE